MKYVPAPTLGPWLGAAAWTIEGCKAYYSLYRMKVDDEYWKQLVQYYDNNWTFSRPTPPYVPSGPLVIPPPAALPPGYPTIVVYPAADYPFGKPLVYSRCRYRRSKGPVKDPNRCDPLVVDLDGNGITTTGLSQGTHFSYAGDGFAQLTGWVDPNEGLLVMDRNGDGVINDGSELFGDQTIQEDGTVADDGFEALSGLDENSDGKIDAADPRFSQLRTWRDFSGDGFSQSDELFTLGELGLKSINLDSTIVGTTDTEGNTLNRLGSFEWLDGTAGLIGEYSFDHDTMATLSNGLVSPPEDIAALPQLWGSGNVCGLHEAMVLDSTGELKSLLEQFVSASDPSTREALMDQILFEWTGSDTIAPNSRGSHIDARKLATLDKFFGDTWTSIYGRDPIEPAAVLLNESYRGLSEMMYALLMFQTHLKDLWAGIQLVVDLNSCELSLPSRDAMG